MSDTLLELEALLPQLPTAVERQRVGQHLASTLSALAEAPLEFSRLSTMAVIADEIGFTREARQRDQLDELLDRADDLARILLAAQDSDGVRAVREQFQQLGPHLTAFDRQVRQHWRNVAQEEFSALAAIGQLFLTIEDTADLGRRLVDCTQRARAAADLPSAAQFRAEILVQRRAREDLEAEQTQVTKDSDVAAFLEALVGQRATLRLVTPTVLAWLESHGALETFRVRGA